MRVLIYGGLIGLPLLLQAQPQRQIARPATPSAQTAASPAAPREQLAQRFRERLTQIARETDGVVGVSVVDLVTGERFGVNDTLTFPQGSAIKIPLLIELYRQAEKGVIKLDEKVAVQKTQQVGGTGVVQWFGDGQSLVSIRDLAVLMIVLSDNTATNILIDKVGMAAVNATMRELGVPAIRLQRLMIRPRESAVGNENVATPAQSAELMARIHRCALPMSADRCADLRRILEIPKDGEFPASVPSSVRVAWKPGTVEGVATSWGLFALPGNPYVVTAMVTYSDDRPAEQALRAVADAAYEYFRRVARASAFGVRVPLVWADSIKKTPPPPLP
ncbi:MAG: serine hydrolase [Gemmatimonadaceae bacterium]|nr:serine hydrolase [Gemmatimonadaceae bacterium]